MTVYEYIKTNGCDYDVYDDVFDTCVTCCDCSEDDGDEYDKFYYRFYAGIQKLVTVKKINKDSLVANWYDLIRENEDVFREFMEEHWNRQYEDDDDFAYEWIRELHLWGAGYVSESTYKDFVENYMSRMKGV